MITTFAVVEAGELVSVFVLGRLVLQKWRAAGAGEGEIFLAGSELTDSALQVMPWRGGRLERRPGESIRQLPDRSYYVTGDFPSGWSHAVPDGYRPLGVRRW